MGCDLDEIQTHPSFDSCSYCMQDEEDPFKIESTRMVTTFLPL